MRLIRLEGDQADSVDVEVVRQTYRPETVLVNGLGATECGLVRQFFIQPGDEVASGSLPVGYPVPGVEISILSADGGDAGHGTEGEIVVYSEYLASEYWADEALTMARFTVDSQGRRVYRTGDVGSLGEDGLLQIWGRIDGPVYINGRKT